MIKKITPDPPPSRVSSPQEKADYRRKVMHDSLAQIGSHPPPQPSPTPLDTLSHTAFRTVGADQPSVDSLFAVQAGVTAQVALNQVSQLLKSAELNADELCPRLDGFERDLLLGLIHSITLSRTVVDALLDGSTATAGS
ncbi:hypothetical protein SAMN05216598_4267 [Pseudomonas asplenii]|uniref:Uncharacterized protein n=1 Tax=Pseudomonas asplenii TaxID=53407 RepID=A0A1H1Y8L3_9PSED|nr:hypothetical protein [Pseudomonas asplenii]SDT17356.1 hypothetical protein SAMN05216598_4267 [Pseudomonas asplenii]